MSACGIIPMAAGSWAWEAENLPAPLSWFFLLPTARPSEEVGPGGGGGERTLATTSSHKATRPRRPRIRGPSDGKIINPVSTFRGELQEPRPGCWQARSMNKTCHSYPHCRHNR